MFDYMKINKLFYILQLYTMKKFKRLWCLLIIILLIFWYVIRSPWIKENLVEWNINNVNESWQLTEAEFTPAPPVMEYFTWALFYPEQKRMPWNYSWNTAVLRAYIHNNPQSITIPEWYRSGTISFNLKNKLLPHWYITLKSNIKLPSNSTRWRLDKSNATIVWNSYVYNIEQFPMYSYINWKIVKGHLFKNLTWTIFTLSVFVWQNDNQIESITFNLNK